MTAYYRVPYRVPRRYRRRSRSLMPAAAAGVALVAAAAVVTGHQGHHHHHHHAAPVQASSNEVLAEQMAARAGWTGSQWGCLDALWTRESGWRIVWNYQGSGAFGIPQALPASKMAAAGSDFMTNPATQIRWGLGYIASRYQTPCGAWAHETAKGWY